MLVAAGLLSSVGTAQAELIVINIGPSPGFNITGINAGLPVDRDRSIDDFPISGNTLSLFTYSFSALTIGLNSTGLTFATGATFATPVNFSRNALIGNGSSYVYGAESLFSYVDVVSPDFGPGSYMGFQTSQGNYGWIEVTWDRESQDFQIFSAAYWSAPNVAVHAGAGATPIPEPGTWAAMAIFAGGAAYAGWRRRKGAKVA